MQDSAISRRTFLIGVLTAPAALGAFGCTRATSEAEAPGDAASTDVVIENFSPSGESQGKVTVPRVVRTDDEWRRLLTPEAYVVTRRAGTERPFSGKYDKHDGDGLYRCICCETALFDSRTKFDSGTGWPSFWKAISSANVRETSDRSLMMLRTAVSCTRCDAHLGHVFEDGPEPTGLRYCMNSVALSFHARA